MYCKRGLSSCPNLTSHLAFSLKHLDYFILCIILSYLFADPLPAKFPTLLLHCQTIRMIIQKTQSISLRISEVFSSFLIVHTANAMRLDGFVLNELRNKVRSTTHTEELVAALHVKPASFEFVLFVIVVLLYVKYAE